MWRLILFYLICVWSVVVVVVEWERKAIKRVDLCDRCCGGERKIKICFLFFYLSVCLFYRYTYPIISLSTMPFFLLSPLLPLFLSLSLPPTQSCLLLPSSHHTTPPSLPLVLPDTIIKYTCLPIPFFIVSQPTNLVFHRPLLLLFMFFVGSCFCGF